MIWLYNKSNKQLNLCGKQAKFDPEKQRYILRRGLFVTGESRSRVCFGCMFGKYRMATQCIFFMHAPPYQSAFNYDPAMFRKTSA